MKLSTTEPTVTSKFPIEVPTNKYYSNFSVYKIWFGKHFFIWKGKSMIQSAQTVATLIERGIRTQPDDTNFLHHVIRHIIKNRVTRGFVEIVDIADFDDTDWMKFLKTEQELLTAHKNDKLCLNNNFTAYVPEWMGAAIKHEFDKWFKTRFTKPKRKKPVVRKKGDHV